MLGKEDKRGQNYWKLNTEILHDEQYKTEMTAFINKQKTCKHDYENIIEWWDMTKVYIKMYAKKHSQQINQRRQKEIAKIKRNIEIRNKADENRTGSIETLFAGEKWNHQ